jgi:hypothetical protein
VPGEVHGEFQYTRSKPGGEVIANRSTFQKSGAGGGGYGGKLPQRFGGITPFARGWRKRGFAHTCAHFFQSKTPSASSINLRHSPEDLMKTATGRNSLAQLRAKTNRELGILAYRQLERSLDLVSRAQYQDAERGYAAALALVTVAELSSAERVQLERKLAELRAALEQRTVAVAVS